MQPHFIKTQCLHPNGGNDFYRMGEEILYIFTNQELFVYPIKDISFVFYLLWKSETLYCVFHKMSLYYMNASQDYILTWYVRSSNMDK